MKMFKRLIFVPVLVVALTISIWANAFAADEIKIGVIGPMKFVQGISHWNGAVMAADEINARGALK